MHTISKEVLIKKYVESLEDRCASAFIGAGLSYNASGLDWNGLVKPYIQQLEENTDDPILGLQYFVTQKNIDKNELKKEIAKKFSNLKYDYRHILLSKLPIRNYWMTNFDALIEDALTDNNEARDIMNSNDSFISAAERRDNIVYKLHGDINSPESIVILKDDYNEYNKTHNHFVTALKNEFATNTMLFLGYALGDPDILNILNELNLDSDTKVTHYIILKKSQQAKKQQYWIDELHKEGIITCLIDEYDEVEEILQGIYQLYMARKVFISGSSCGDYGKFTKDEAHQMLYKLGYDLINDFKDQDVSIISGYGLGVGPDIIEGAAEAVATNNLDFGKRVLIYPFPKMYYSIPSEDRTPELEDHFKNYRNKMIDKCGVAFFLFGNKIDKNGNIVNADGLKTEFEIAHQQGKYVFPIGSTGWAAKELADKVLSNYSLYNNTSKEVEKLFLELNLPEITADEIVDKIIQIIDLLAYRVSDSDS